MFELTCTSKIEDEIIMNNEDHEVNVKQTLGTVLKAPNTEQLFESDSDEDNFGNLALDYVPEPNTEEPNFFPKECSNKHTVYEQCNRCYNNPTNFRRSVSAEAGLNDAKTGETTICFNNQLVSDNPTLLDLKEQLKRKTRECDTLNRENQELKGLLYPVASEQQKSLFKAIWSYPSDRNNRSLIELKMEINMLNQNITDYKKQLQDKDKEIAKLQHKSITEKHDLKHNFYKKTEAQKGILEEMDFTVRNMEGKLNVEKKLRENREAEISHIHTYLSKRDNYFRNQIDDKDARIKRIEANHNQELQTIGKIIKQKDEEISRLNQNYNLILDKCNRQVEAINHKFQTQPLDGIGLEEIKTNGLEHSLQLKSKQLHEAYVEINKLQKELNDTHQELEEALKKLSKSKDRDVLKQQLENVRQQISNVLNDFDEEPSLCTPTLKCSINPDLPLEFLNKAGNKDE